MLSRTHTRWFEIALHKVQREVGTLYVLIIPCAPLARRGSGRRVKLGGRIVALSAIVNPQPVELGFQTRRVEALWSGSVRGTKKDSI